MPGTSPPGRLLARLVCAAALAPGACADPGPADWAAARRHMVEQQLRARGIRDGRVLAALGRVPRHEFVPGMRRGQAYEDRALPIGAGQTISQPYVVALMTAAID